MQQFTSTADEWFEWLSDSFDPNTDSRSYHYIGRTNVTNKVVCTMDTIVADFLLINTGGGTKRFHDYVANCPKVILSPFTTSFSQLDLEKVIFDVRTNGYTGTDLISHIFFEKGQIQILFNEFELTSFDTTMKYSCSEKNLLISLQWGSNTFQISIHGYDSTETKIILFNKKQHMIIPKISPDSDFGTPITSFEVFVMCSQISYQNLISNAHDECIADIIYSDKTFKLLTTIQFKDSQINDTFVVGSPYSDIIRIHDSIKFARGRNGNDFYYVHKDAIIFNNADDNALDIVMMSTKIPRTFSRRFNSLLVLNVEIRDFFDSLDNQHVIFIDNEMKHFFPLDYTYEMTPFIQATPHQNAFSLDTSFDYSYIVLHDGTGDADYEMYRDNDDLLILQQHQRYDNKISFVITIENFYIDIEKWSNVTWIMYYDNGTLNYRYDFIFGNGNNIIEYKTKLKQDYLDIFVEYIFNSTSSDSILVEKSDRIGILNIDQTISIKNIEITQTPDEHLVFIDHKSEKTFKIRNWNSVLNRISIIELPVSIEHFDAITIRDLNRFDLNQIAEMQRLLNLAGESYELLQEITPLTEVGVKCIVSNASLSDGEINSHKCLGFNSLDEQVKFVNKYCELETLEWFKINTTIDQIRSTITFLKNNLVLSHVFESDKDNNCEPFLLSIYASKFVVNDPNRLGIDLFAAVNNTNKFKELIQIGANPMILTNDSFARNILHMTALAENYDLVKFIVSHRLVDINAVDLQDKTALYYVFKRISYHCERDIIDKNCFKRDDVRNLSEIAEYLLSNSGTVKRRHEISEIAIMLCIYTSHSNIQIFCDDN